MAAGFRDLKVFELALPTAREIFWESKKFPVEERYSLIDQIRRSSRSVCSNTAEGYRKKRYPVMFVSKIADADGEAAETQVHLDLTKDCGYLSEDKHAYYIAHYEEIGRMLGSMSNHPEKFKFDRPAEQ